MISVATALIAVLTLYAKQSNASSIFSPTIPLSRNDTVPTSHYELIDGDLYKVNDDDYRSSLKRSGNTRSITSILNDSTRQKGVWDFISTFDSYKTSASYKMLNGRPTLENFKYVVVPIWWSDMDTSDPKYQMDPATVVASWIPNKQYYIDMSWGKMANGVTYETLEQQLFNISSTAPSWGNTESSAIALVQGKGYVEDVDYNGIGLMYFVSQSGPFSGAGGWAGVNGRMLWSTYPGWFDVTRHEVGHNFGHHHHLSVSYTYRDTRPNTGEGSAPYDGFDMMSGGNGYAISHIAAASKWFWNWIPDSSIILMQPEGSTTECPTCKSSGTFTLRPFDDIDLPPTSSRKMGIHIPIDVDGNRLYSYWLSYRSGNDGVAQNGLSVHLSWFDLGGYFGASYDSMNFDAFGDTDTTADSFVVEDTCYHLAPPGYLKDNALVASEMVQPVVCVDSINPGTSITVTVTFIDKENLPVSQVSIGQDIELQCSSSTVSTGTVALDANKYNLIHVKDTGNGGEINFEMCTTSGTASAFFHDEYPYSAIAYGSEASYGSYKSLITSKRCSVTDSITYKSDYGETFIVLPPVVGGGSNINVAVSCKLTECLVNQYLSNGICVQCPNNGRSTAGSTSSSACGPCPGGTTLPHPRSLVCAMTDTYTEIASASKWRLWAPDFDTNKGWVWDIPEIEFYESIDCSGSSIDTSTASAIASGSAGNGWWPSNAFDGNMWSTWGGRSDSDNLFYIGIDFGDTLQTVRCVKYYRGESNNFALNVRVQAYADGQWKNAWIEKDLEQVTTYNIISLDYQKTSKSPTTTPTVEPTKSPNSLPTANPSCQDSPLRFRVNINGMNKMRSCAWPANKQTARRCKLEGVTEHCPSTCDACNNCVDSIARLKFVFKGRKIARSCIWVANKDTANRCSIDGMDVTCRSTCGKC